jgi:acetolactate synthase I/II/III large subunit
MNGAESLIRTVAAGGVGVCFTNPGTSEMHVVSALDQLKEIRCVLGLFEGVVTGAADGYARMAEKPACTLLHLGPGLANGLANLHNARRARVPIVNIVGQHAIAHMQYDTPLSSDIEAIARPYSKWLRTSHSTSELGRDASEAIVAARNKNGQIATLIVPADVAWNEGGVISETPLASAPPVPSLEGVDHAAAMLRSGLKTAILISGNALYSSGLETAGRIAVATGAKLFAPYPFVRIERGHGFPVVERVAYINEQAVEQFKEFRQLILVGAAAPLPYFAHPTKSITIVPADCEIHPLAGPEEDCVGALNAVADSLELLKEASSPVLKRDRSRPSAGEIPTGEITTRGVAAAVAALLPENAIVIDESMTSGRELMPATQTAPHHDWLGNTGGSIGIAMPLALGAAIACPGRRALCLSADGSGMYTNQALWTMAREGLNITTVILANRAYAVLKREFSNFGLGNPGPLARSLFDIGRPDLDWVALAKGMGVPGVRVTSLEEFAKALRAGFETDGPTLIEVPLYM